MLGNVDHLMLNDQDFHSRTQPRATLPPPSRMGSYDRSKWKFANDVAHFLNRAPKLKSGCLLFCIEDDKSDAASWPSPRKNWFLRLLPYTDLDVSLAN